MLSESESFQQDGTDNSLNMSSAEWQKWILEEVERRERSFANDPDEMIAAYNRERNYTNDYRRRQVLELLQNADDASVGEKRSQKASVVLSKDGLCFANTGRPFSDKGLKSLMVSDVSPKKNSRNSYIGNRGLGFRSVLSWTDRPFILSGNLRVAFDKEHARHWLKELAEKHPNVGSRWKEEYPDLSTYPIPTLTLPRFITDDRVHEVTTPGSEQCARFLAVAEKLREDHDSVVALPFTESGAYEDAMSQVEQLGKETLLFLRNVRDLRIRTPRGEKLWTARDRSTYFEVSSSDDRSVERWIVFEKAGEIPEELLSEDQRGNNGYELRVAVPIDSQSVPGFIFNYFPTRARLPLPVVAHATLEVTQNRQNLPENDVNRYVLEVLADFLAEIGERVADDAELGADDRWLPLKLVSPSATFDPVIESLGFDERLLDSASRRRIVPVRDGRMLAPVEAKRLETLETDWLPDAGFGDVLIPASEDDLGDALEALEIDELTGDELRERLNSNFEPISVEHRAVLIERLVTLDLMPDPAPDLLIDANGAVIPAGTTTFLPPQDGEASVLADWMTLRILSGQLMVALKDAFSIVSNRELSSKLRALRLQPYSLADLTSAVNAEVNRRVGREPRREREHRLEGLQILFDLYEAGKGEEADGQHVRLGEIRVRVPNRSGEFPPATTLYFGEEYPAGALTELLYGARVPEKMVCTPDDLRLDADTERIQQFLSWLGVASRPRTVLVPTLRDQGYKEYVSKSLAYPATFDEYRADGAENLRNTKIENVTSVDDLDGILQGADPHAIVAWVATDERFQGLGANDRDANLLWLPLGLIKYRQLRWQSVPSYVLYKVGSSRWLPTTDGSRKAPEECYLTSNLSDDVQELFPRPALDPSNKVLARLGINSAAARYTLERVGVRTSIDEMPWDDFYGLLLRLPEVDPEGEHARSVYSVLAARPGEESPEGANCEEFMEYGELWCRQGDAGSYMPVNSGVYYADDATIPAVIAREIPMLDLGRRRGAQKMKRLFGVRPLNYDDIAVGIEPEQVVPHSRERDLAYEVEGLKPFVYAMRIHSDENARELRRLKSLEVRLCYGLKGYVIIERSGSQEIEREFSVDDGEMVLDGNTAYLCSQPDNDHLLTVPRLLEDPLISHDVGEILARLLGVENGGDFAYVAQCPPERRQALLNRMLGENSAPHVEKAREKLEVGPEPDDSVFLGGGDPIPEEAPEHPHDPSASDEEDPPGAGPEPKEPKGEGGVGGVEVHPQPPSEPDEPREPIRRKIGVSLKAGVTHKQRSVADAGLCQQVAFWFEESEGQGRFPKMVDYFTGTEAPGCDILSFASEEACERYKESGDERLVERFIEVKGRSASRGKVFLEGNELESARKRREKFYIYRVFDAGDGTFEVAILSDPLSGLTRVAHEVDVFHDSRTRAYDVRTNSV